MKQLFEDINILVISDTIDPSLHLNKLYEETGELAMAINKTTGRKITNESDTTENIRENILEEIADSIQTLFAIANCYDITYETIEWKMQLKNNKYKENLHLKRHNAR
jgi:NTP pyrophosphatase (non-canonical NTP hydrolase)